MAVKCQIQTLKAALYCVRKKVEVQDVWEADWDPAPVRGSDIWDGIPSVELGKLQRPIGGFWGGRGVVRQLAQHLHGSSQMCMRLNDPPPLRRGLPRFLLLRPCPFRCSLPPLLRYNLRQKIPLSTRISRQLRTRRSSTDSTTMYLTTTSMSFARERGEAGRIRRQF